MQEQRMIRRRKYAVRYKVLFVLFSVFCAVFLARLINFQIVSRDEYAPVSSGDEQVERIYTDALRGNICDRNGKILVTDDIKYSLILNYITIPSTRAEVNHVILAALNALEAAGGDSVLPKSMSPFTGTYPSMSFSEEFTQSREMYDEFVRLLEKNFVTEDYPLEQVMAENGAISISRYYARKYNIVKEQKGEEFSYTSDFTDEDISRLIAVRYEMDRLGFGPDDPFVLAEDVSYDFSVYIKELAVDGLEILEHVKRRYNYPGYASHILGHIGQIPAEKLEEYLEKDYSGDAYVGRSGAEMVFEDYLRGIDGTMKIVEDAYGNIVSKTIVEEPVPGKDVYLSIDMDLQMSTEDALRDNIEVIHERAAATKGTQDGEDASKAAAVAMPLAEGTKL